MKKEDLYKNTGVIIREPSQIDWVAGKETGIAFESIQKTGQWDEFLPIVESQRNAHLDFSSCVSFSATNCIEILLNRMIMTMEMSYDNLRWLTDNGYIDSNDKVNFSDRFTAKMSGTTKEGNYLTKVGDSIRNDGLVPESVWGVDDSIKTWDDYYSEIPENIKALGLEFNKRFKINYEWVLAGSPNLNKVKEHLQQAPLQLASATCSPWNTTEIIEGCGFTTNHATVLYGFTENYLKDFDSYNPYCKKLALNYGIAYVLKYVCEEIEQEDKFSEFKTIMKYGERSKEIVMLQNLFKELGLFPLNVDSTGYYGGITQRSVMFFCIKYEVASLTELLSVNGMWCGNKTLKELNKQVKIINEKL